MSDKNKPKPQIKEKPYQQPKHVQTVSPGADTSSAEKTMPDASAAKKATVNKQPKKMETPPTTVDGSSSPQTAEPLPKQVAASKQSNQSESLSPKADSATGICVLIVDDNPSFQKLMAMSLSMHPKIGVIDFADSGERALKKAKTKVYDMIFMDAMMAGIDGYVTCGILRKNQEYKNTPIIMVTGMDTPLDEAKAILAGSTSYVTKPVQQLPFKELIDREIEVIEYKKTKESIY